MKIKIVAAGLILFLLNSCKKDFLEIPSQTSLSTATFFKTQSDFQQAVNGAYAPLRTLYLSTGAWAMGEMHSDNTHYILNPGFRATIDQENTADFIYDPTSVAATTKYTTDYLIIARANQVLAPIDAANFSDATVKSNIKGQAFFLRAFAYFDLVQFFGRVPLHLKPATGLTETAIAPSGIDSVYAQIIADAKQAATLLPGKKVQEAGRATSGAARTLLANVYLAMNQKQYASAETLLKDVVTSGDYSLMADYNAVYNPSNKNNSESVFEVQYKEGSDGYASNFIYQFLPVPMTAAQVAGVTGNGQSFTAGEGYNIPTPDIIAAYEGNDSRQNASIGYTVAADGKTYPYIKKYNHPHAQVGLTNDNWPVYRYAETLLFLAEALNEQNKPSEALTYLNQVRERAGLGDMTTTDQASLRDIIQNERRVELAFENKRWTDLVRTGKAVQVITAYGAKVKANPAAYYYQAGFAPVPASFTAINLTFPYPVSEAALNPLLK